MKEPSYGRLVGRLYDHFFGPSYVRKRAKIQQSLKVFARAQRGEIVQDNYTELFPKLRFERKFSQGTMVVTPSYRGLDAFNVSAIFKSKHPSLERFPFPVVQVFSRNLLKHILPNTWMKTIVAGDETFDHWFISRALEPFPLDSFLGKEGKELLFNLRYLFGKNNLYISCQGSKILVRKAVNDNLLCQPLRLKELWRLSRVLFRRLEKNLKQCFMHERADWIKFVGESDNIPVCKVCGDVIFFNRVNCSRCETAHHLDCWEYNGGCSIYACGCRDYVVRYSKV